MAYFKTKNPIWVNFGGTCNGRCWYILRPFGLFYGHLVYFMVIWCIFPVLVHGTKKNLATLVSTLKAVNPNDFFSTVTVCHSRIRRPHQNAIRLKHYICMYIRRYYLCTYMYTCNSSAISAWEVPIISARTTAAQFQLHVVIKTNSKISFERSFENFKLSLSELQNNFLVILTKYSVHRKLNFALKTCVLKTCPDLN
jgi:hypothetical protein